MICYATFTLPPRSDMEGSFADHRALRRRIALGILRRLFRRAHGVEPQSPRFVFSQSGQPRLLTADGATPVSLAFAGRFGMAALSGLPVGIDLDGRALGPGWAHRVNTLAGRTLIAEVDDPLAAWVRIESALKSLGGTLAGDITRLWLGPPSCGRRPGGLLGQPKPSLWVSDLPAPPHFRAALASTTPALITRVYLED